MAIAIKVDIIGSFLSRGFVAGQRDRAVRRALVTGLPVSNQKHQLAIDEFTALYPFHQSTVAGFALPLARVTTQQFGPDRVVVRGEYFVPFTTFSFDDPKLTLRISERPADIASVWYQHPIDDQGNLAFGSDGRPNGFIDWGVASVSTEAAFFPESDATAEAIPWVWHRTGSRLYVPVVLSVHPLSFLNHLVDRVNDAPTAFTLGNDQLVYPAGTLLFHPPLVDVVESSFGPITFNVRYTFTFAPTGHVRQSKRFNPDIGTSGEWEFFIAPTHESADFDVIP